MKPQDALDSATYQSTVKKKQTTQPSLTPQQTQRLSEIKARAGWIPPDQAIALARSAASDEAVDAVATMKGRQIIDEQGSEEPEGGWARRFLYNPFKAASRWTLSALQFVPEFVVGGSAQFAKPGDTLFQDGWFEATSLGTMIKNPEARGEGFFMSKEAQELQAERARKYRGTVNGSAWTPGRSSANLVFKENSLPYNIMSGVIDALVLIKMDPTGPVTKAYKYATKGKYTVPLLAAEETAGIRAALESEAGITRGLAGAVLDGTKFDNFARTNPRMQQMVNFLTKEKDALNIAEKFDYALPNELVVALSKTDDPEVVKGILAAGWTVARGALPSDIRLVQGGRFKSAVGELLVQRMPLIDGIRKSRYFTTAESGAFTINGTVDDNKQAVKSIVSYLRTAGVNQATVTAIANQALESFTTSSTSTAQKKTLDLFEATLRGVMDLDGIPRESIDELFARGRGGLDRIRRGLQSRTGRPIDNGYASFILNKNREYIPDDEIDTLLGKLGATGDSKLTITSPLELSELLDRTVMMPSIREVRRYTRNPLFRNLLGDKVGKLPITSKRRNRLVEVITDQAEYDRLGGEIGRLLKIRNRSPQEAEELDKLYQARAALTKKEMKRVITPDQNAAIAAIDHIQNQLWKPLALATGGYVVRNSLDAQIRMAFSDLPSVFTHPFEYINLVLGSSNKMTLRLENIANVRRSAKPGQVFPEGTITVDDLVEDVRNAMMIDMRSQGIGALDIENHKIATGVFDNVERGMTNGLELHTDGIVQNMRRVNAETLNRAAAQTLAEYGSPSQQAREDAANRIVNILMKDQKLRKEVDDMHEFGFQVTNQATGITERTPGIKLTGLSEEDRRAHYYQWAMRTIVDKVQALTGNIPEAQFMAAFGYTPITAKGKMTGAFDDALDNLNILESKNNQIVGSLVKIDENNVGVITQFRNADTGQVVIDPFDGSVVSLERVVATVQPVHPNQSFGPTLGDREARNLFDSMPISEDPKIPGLPAVVKRELLKTDEKDKKTWDNVMERYTEITDWFFGRLYPTISRRLERSPVFREFYYREVYDYVDQLRPEAAQKFLDDVTKAATEAGMKPAEYVGDKKILAAMQKSTKTGGNIGIEELDDYAKFVALTKTKELLYNVSSKSNLEDALRIIMPFAPAWREIITTYTGFLRSNPLNASRSFQRIYTGATGADPDNDGRGFFYEDPNTKQMMFMFPASGTLAKALTGLEAPLEAPVRRFSQGLQVVPALGPMGQIAASKILPMVPEPEFITEIILPYGSKGVSTAFNPTPGWLNKGLQALSAPTGDLGTVFGNTYVETYRALSASGDYDLNNRDDLIQMEKDAKFKARILTAFRAASQFFGPTAGATEFKIDTAEGDVFVGELIKTFYDMQANPQIGYDRAIPTFLEQFGDEVALYVSSKSKSVAEGLEATKEFQDWADQNGELVSAYPSVARYLAPAGSDFSFTVWDQQIQRGERVRLSPDDIRRLAQQRIGSAMFRAARKQVGPYPSEEAKDLLKRYRGFLHKKYPGFPLVAEFEVGAYYNQVAELKEMVLDRRVAGDETAEAVKQYLIARDAAIRSAGTTEQGFRTARDAVQQRTTLDALGLSLSERVPNFARIYDRLLASEVE